jgi:biotin carboxyl carrier protein
MNVHQPAAASDTAAAAMLKRTAELEQSLQRGASRRRVLRAVLMLGGILIVAAASAGVWLRGGRYVSADDAYVHAAKLMATTDISGIVTSIDVKEGQAVKAGEVLFKVDPRQFRIALDNVRAQLAQTALAISAMKEDYRRMQSDIEAQQSQVDLDQSNFDRYAVLVKSDSVSKANYDQARFVLAADTNKLKSLRQQAEVQLARLGGDPDIPVSAHPRYRQAQVDEAQRPQEFLHRQPCRLHHRLDAVRPRRVAHPDGAVPPAAGHVWRRPGAAVAIHHARSLSRRAARLGHGGLGHGRDGGSDSRPHARRLSHRCL